MAADRCGECVEDLTRMTGMRLPLDEAAALPPPVPALGPCTMEWQVVARRARARGARTALEVGWTLLRVSELGSREVVRAQAPTRLAWQNDGAQALRILDSLVGAGATCGVEHVALVLRPGGAATGRPFDDVQLELWHEHVDDEGRRTSSLVTVVPCAGRPAAFAFAPLILERTARPGAMPGVSLTLEGQTEIEPGADGTWSVTLRLSRALRLLTSLGQTSAGFSDGGGSTLVLREGETVAVKLPNPLGSGGPVDAPQTAPPVKSVTGDRGGVRTLAAVAEDFYSEHVDQVLVRVRRVRFGAEAAGNATP